MVTIVRIVISLFFILNGIFQVSEYEQSIIWITSLGLPYHDFFLIAGITFELAGGFMLLFGYKLKTTTSVLIVFLTVATITLKTPQLFSVEFKIVLLEIFENLSVIGALFILLYTGFGNTFKLPLTSEIEDIPIYNVKL